MPYPAGYDHSDPSQRGEHYIVDILRYRPANPERLDDVEKARRLAVESLEEYGGNLRMAALECGMRLQRWEAAEAEAEQAELSEVMKEEQ